MKTNVSGALVTFLNGVCQGSIGGEFYVVDLYTITLVSGYVLRMATWDQDIVFGGNTYISSWPYVNRSQVKQALGMEPAELEMSIFSPPQAMLNTSTMLAAIGAGQFDGASLNVSRLYMQTLNNVSLGVVIWFAGNMAGVSELGRTHAKIIWKDKRELLNTALPRNLVSPGCRHTLFDAGCSLLPGSFSVSGVVLPGSTSVKVNTSLNNPGPTTSPTGAPGLSDSAGPTGTNLAPNTYFVVVTYVGAQGESAASPESTHAIASTTNVLTVTSPPSAAGASRYNVYAGNASGGEELQNDSPIPIGTNWTESGNGLTQGPPPPQVPTGGYFTQGTITFSSGPNSGLSRFVSGYAGGGVFTILPPLPAAPTPGDLITALAGCDKLMSTCNQKFSNIINFAGQPYVPSPEQGV